jgi:glucose-6-phosphate isomerase
MKQRPKYILPKNCFVPVEQRENEKNSLVEYINYLSSVQESGVYDKPESSIFLPFDMEYLKETTRLLNEIDTTSLKKIFIVGIGGSNLGTQAVYRAMKYRVEEGKPELIFLDTISDSVESRLSESLSALTNSSEYLVFIVSKSGTTLEVIYNSALFPSLDKSRTIIITDEGSILWNKAKEENINALKIPAPIGGRFSVLTAVGIAPLYLIFGKEILDLLEGARTAVVESVRTELDNNPALESAVILNVLYRDHGFRIHNSFTFDPRLEFIGLWYRQLMSESLGKKREDGTAVGILPIVSVGTTDLHSQLQLYIGGPRNITTSFIYASQSEDKKPVSNSIFKKLGDVDLEGKSINQIHKVIFESVVESYLYNDLSHEVIDFGDITLFSLGYFLQWKMMEIMYLGHLLNVNTFNQPNVEDYKHRIRSRF